MATTVKEKQNREPQEQKNEITHQKFAVFEWFAVDSPYKRRRSPPVNHHPY